MQNTDSFVYPFAAGTYSGAGLIYPPACYVDHDAFLYVKRGKCSLHIGTRTVDCPVGTVYYVPNGLVHWVESADTDGVILSLVFSHSMIAERMDNIDADLYYMFGVQAKTKIFSYGEEDAVYPLLLENMALAADEYDAREVACSLFISSCINRMMGGVLRDYFNARGEKDENVYHNVLRLRPVLAYIEANFQGKIYVEAMAELMNVSPDHFTKLFRDSIGTTPIDYINALRVNRAMILLAAETQSVADVSQKLGFSAPNHFHKIFRAYLGMSPLAFRKIAK